MVVRIKLLLSLKEQPAPLLLKGLFFLSHLFAFLHFYEEEDVYNVAHALALAKDLHFSSLSVVKLIQLAMARQEQKHASVLSYGTLSSELQ